MPQKIIVVYHISRKLYILKQQIAKKSLAPWIAKTAMKSQILVQPAQIRLGASLKGTRSSQNCTRAIMVRQLVVVVVVLYWIAVI